MLIRGLTLLASLLPIRQTIVYLPDMLLTDSHHHSLFPPDDSKRAPKGPTFGDFVSQGRTPGGSRGDRDRGRGRGQKPSYRCVRHSSVSSVITANPNGWLIKGNW